MVHLVKSGNRRMKSNAILAALCLASMSAFALNITIDGEAVRYFDGRRSVLVITNSCNVTVVGSGKVELLAVGGGGGGGANHSDNTFGGGGGGAGGIVHKVDFAVSPGTTRIIVGAGGGLAANGGDTSVFGVTAYGGGAGASYLMRSVPGDGASGGGATYNSGAVSPQSGGLAVYGDVGNAGNKGADAVNPYGPGGGGGAGAAAVDGTGSAPGVGGDGLPFSITGMEVWYGGGGSGYRNGNTGEAMQRGGRGGGGAGGQNGTDGLGGGGGGGAVGGCGTVIISFEMSYRRQFDGATGGTITPVRGGRVHTFMEDGTFTMPVAGLVDILMVGGGGGGGTNDIYGGAGGGAGGVVYKTSYVLPAGEHAVTIGLGGDLAHNGGETRFANLVAYGGGGGASYLCRSHGLDGASGGGATFSGSACPHGKAIYYEEGNAGHDGASANNPWGPGGGGGAGEAAPDNTTSSPGIGGNGLQYAITGTLEWYGGGGSGWRNGNTSEAMQRGGYGGGGAGGQKGMDGKGGGGGGGAVGGSGVVIIRYALPSGMNISLR